VAAVGMAGSGMAGCMAAAECSKQRGCCCWHRWEPQSW
jgi:hypothetical protein